MSDYENPYQIPETPIVPEKLQSSGVSLSETALRYLKEASPWLRFVGIIGFIGCGFLALTGIIAVIGSLAISETSEYSQTWIISAVYLPAGVLLFFPSLYTFNFGSKLRSYLINNMEEDLELAFRNNKSLWKFNGILYIIYLALIPVIFIITIVVGITALLPGFF